MPTRPQLPVLPKWHWLQLAGREADAAWLRRDALANLLMIARVIGWSADKATGRSRPTIARIMAATGLSKRCVQKWCRWLEGRGLLEVLEPGTTPQFRPGLLARRHAGNLAREWRLTVPLVDRSCTPPLDFDLERDPPVRAREAGVIHMDRAARGQPSQEKIKTGMDRAARGLPVLPRAGRASLHDHPKTRSEGLAAAAALQDHSQALGLLSARHVRHLTRVLFQAGGTAADVLHALDYGPDGRRHGYTDPVRSPAGWVRSRLARWLGPDGVPLPLPSQLRAEAGRIRVSDQATRREQAAAREAAGVDSAGPAARARRMLAASSPAAARVITERALRRRAPTAGNSATHQTTRE